MRSALCFALIMKKDHSFIVNKKSSFDLLSAQLSTCTVADFQQIINKWVLNQDIEQNQLDDIITIFEQIEVYIKDLNEVVMKTWRILIEERIWRAKFTSKNEVIRALNTSFLKNVWIRVQTSRNRKERFIMTIKKECVTILACVTRKMLRKEMLNHLDDVEQYYRWW